MAKKICLFISVLSILIVLSRQSVAQMADKKAGSSSTITSVTVFLDRAMVTRTISKRLPQGEHVLIFENLPESIDQNSIQANGEGNAVLRDVKFKQEFYSVITDEEKRKLNEKALAIQDSLVDANDLIANANKEQKMVEELIEKIMTRISTVSNNEKMPPESDPDKWLKMVDYYRAKLDVLNKQIRTTERKIRLFNDEESLIETKMNSLGDNQEKSKNIVEVLIEVKGESEVLVNLSYMVQGPRWYPVYDLRVYTDNKKMKLTYQAMIQQNTTEDWDNVKIKLSTARANLGGQQPTLSPWYLSFYDYTQQRDDADDLSKRKAEMTQMYNAVPAEKDRAEEEPKELNAGKIAINEATIEAGATSAVFVVSGRNTIKSDNQQHKVTIKMDEFDAVFRYSTVPKLMPYVYLKAKVTNTTDFPLLPGSTNVFLDNNFVSTSQLELVSPGQEFWTFLGVDDGIEVKYKTIKQYQKDEGVISKKNKYIFDYIIEVTSNKKNEEEIVIWDQIPMANSEDIEVTLIEPNPEKDKEHVKIDDYKFIEWFYKIKPKEKIKLPFQFTVESPKNKTISGL